MAGPEPYPYKEKWTPEQERAYAEGRRSAKATESGQPSRSGKRRRVVRTDAGARRYRVPIGAEIGSARNSQAAEAQKDTDSTARYAALVGTDPAAQAAAMRSLDDGQLQRLSRVAYSFRSSDQNVVRLRIGVANELRRRGFNVNDFGGLGGGGGQSRPARTAPQRGLRKAAPSPKTPPTVRNRSAMTARRKDRKLLEMSVPQLRQALRVFSRISPDNRRATARILVNRAVELSAVSLLGPSVIEAANLTQDERNRVIELAGRWKHGWIPLDSVALRSKMKGGNGKPWWSGGKQRKTDSASTMRRTLEGKRIAAERKARGEAPSGGKPRPFVAVPKQGGAATKAQPGKKLQGWARSNELDRMDKGTRERIGNLNREGRFNEAADTAQASRKTNQTNLRRRENFRGVVNNQETRQKYKAIQISPEGRAKIAKTEARNADRRAKASATRKTRQGEIAEANKKYYATLNDDQLRAEIKVYKDQPSMLADASDRKRLAGLIKELQRRKGVSKPRTAVVKSSPKPERGSNVNVIEGLNAEQRAEYNSLVGEDRYDMRKKEAYAAARRAGASHSEAMSFVAPKRVGHPSLTELDETGPSARKKKTGKA